VGIADPMAVWKVDDLTAHVVLGNRMFAAIPARRADAIVFGW
jgi:hypothetical protein